ncbi:MAG: lamin tail domain-containing protein [Sphingobacteriales bacterium]|nr:lamin tail domain-containing protein [Sphingobacteriales bacterium]
MNKFLKDFLKLLTIICIVATNQLLTAQVVINEVQPDPGNGESGTGEFIELYCPPGVPCDVGCHIIATDDNNILTIPAGTIIPAGGYLVLGNSTNFTGGVSNNGLSQTAGDFNGWTAAGAGSNVVFVNLATCNCVSSSTSAVAYDNGTSFITNGDGQRIVFFDPTGAIVDAVSYCSQAGANLNASTSLCTPGNYENDPDGCGLLLGSTTSGGLCTQDGSPLGGTQPEGLAYTYGTCGGFPISDVGGTCTPPVGGINLPAIGDAAYEYVNVCITGCNSSISRQTDGSTTWIDDNSPTPGRANDLGAATATVALVSSCVNFVPPVIPIFDYDIQHHENDNPVINVTVCQNTPINFAFTGEMLNFMDINNGVANTATSSSGGNTTVNQSGATAAANVTLNPAPTVSIPDANGVRTVTDTVQTSNTTVGTYTLTFAMRESTKGNNSSSGGECYYRYTVNVTVAAEPAAPVAAISSPACWSGSGTVSVPFAVTSLTAGDEIRWYDAATGGTLLGTSTTTATTLTITPDGTCPQTATVYASVARPGCCESVTRTAVTTDIYVQPSFSLTETATPTCADNTSTIGFNTFPTACSAYEYSYSIGGTSYGVGGTAPTSFASVTSGTIMSSVAPSTPIYVRLRVSASAACVADQTLTTSVAAAGCCVPPAYTAVPSCAGADQDEFYIIVSGLTASETYDVNITGAAAEAGTVGTGGSGINDIGNTGATTYTFGPFVNDLSGTQVVSIEITDQANAACPVTTEVVPVLCGYTQGCSCDAPQILAQFAPLTVNSGTINNTTYVYVLVDDNTGNVAVVNNTGLFTSIISPNPYTVYAFNVLNADLAAFLADAGIQVGSPYATPATSCVGPCASQSYNCNCCNPSAGTQSTASCTSICSDTGTGSVASTINVAVDFGAALPAANYAYVWYVVAADGTIEAVISSANYNSAIPANFNDDLSIPAGLTAGSYCIQGLNYDPADADLAVNPLPALNDNINTYLATLTENDAVATAAGVVCGDINVSACTAFTVLDPIVITAVASCTGAGGVAAADNEYYVAVTAITGGLADYSVSIGAATQTFSGSTLYFGPYVHSGTGLGTQTVTVTDANAVAPCTACTAQVEVVEALCPLAENSCDCTASPNSGTIIAQSTPGTFNSNGYTQVYILVENDGTYNGSALAVGAIIDANHTGLFTGLENGDYEIYALNVLDSELASLESALLGAGTFLAVDGDVSDNAAIADVIAKTAPFDIYCYIASAPAPYAVACNCCVADAGDLEPTTPTTAPFEICEGSDLLDDAAASAAFGAVYTQIDEITPIPAADYEYAYILADSLGEILQYNLSGDFDYSLLPAGTYDIFGLSYNIVLNTPASVLSYLSSIDGAADPADNDIQEIVDADNDNSSDDVSNGTVAISPTPATVGLLCLDLDEANTTAVKVQVIILPLPIANPVTLVLCDDGDGTVDFTLADAENPAASTNQGDGDSTLGEIAQDEVDNGVSGLTVTYHATQADADADLNAITTEVVSVGVDETIYARVETADGCYAIAPVTLTVNPLPVVMADTLILCDNNGDGSAAFDLTSAVVTSTVGAVITYHATQADADAGANDLSSPYTSSGTTLYVRVEDALSACYNTTTLLLQIAPDLTANAVTLTLCDTDTNTGNTLNFDLTAAEDATAVSNTSATDVDNGVSGLTVTYHLTQADADADINAINPTNPFAGANGQILYARVEDASVLRYGYGYFSNKSIACIDRTNTELCVDANPYNLTSLASAMTASAGIFVYEVGGVAVADATSYTAADGDVVDVTFTDAATGCVNTTTITFTVNPLPVLTAQTPELCVDANPYNLTSLASAMTASTGIFVYEVGGVAVADATSYTAADGDVVDVTFTDAATGCVNTTTITFTVNPLPVLTAQTPELCVDANPYNLTSLAGSMTASAGIFVYEVGGVAVADATSYTAADGDVVDVTFTDAATGCVNTTTITFTVNPLPVLTAQTPELCVDANPYNLTSLASAMAASTGIFVYEVGGVAVADATSYTAADGDVVDVTFTDAATGCVNTTTITFTVNPLPVLTAQTPELCVDANPYNLTSLASAMTASAGIFVYEVGGVAVADATSYTAADGDVIDVTFTDAATGCVNTTTITFTVNPLPIVNAVLLEQCDNDTNPTNSISFNLNAAEDAGNSLNVNGIDVDNSGDATTGGLTVSYHTVADADNNVNALNPTNPYMGLDDVVLYVRIADANGCYTTSTVTLNVLPLPILTAQTPELCVDANPYNLTSLASAMTASAGIFVYEVGGVAVADATSYTAADGDVVDVTFTDAATGCVNTTTITFTVNPLPVLTAQTPELCVDANPYNLTSLASAMTASAGIFVYEVGGVAVADATSYTAADGDVVDVTFTDAATGCVNTTTITFTVNPLPVLTAQTPSYV